MTRAVVPADTTVPQAPLAATVAKAEPPAKWVHNRWELAELAITQALGPSNRANLHSSVPPRPTLARRDILEAIHQSSPFVPQRALPRGPAVFLDGDGARIALEPSLSRMRNRQNGRFRLPRQSLAGTVGFGDNANLPSVEPDSNMDEIEHTLGPQDDFAGIGSGPVLADWAPVAGGDSDVETEDGVAYRLRGERRGRLHLETFDRAFQ
ncbi:hypothetical protein GQ53DRAFT_834647 [Thozetella sp. PMI_491]|nr:hypothetical protein GQ53DRAFT_834647 [Thozetella sp. PMI_491]